MDWELTSVSHGSHDDSHDSLARLAWLAGSLARSLSRPCGKSTLRRSGQFSIFGLVFFLPKTLLRSWDTGVCNFVPRDRILIYRTWTISDQIVFLFEQFLCYLICSIIRHEVLCVFFHSRSVGRVCDIKFCPKRQWKRYSKRTVAW